MKTIFRILMFVFCPVWLMAQTTINKTYPVKTGQEVVLSFDYPKLVKVSTWDKNELEIIATVRINDGENDKSFSLQDTLKDGKLSISNKIDWKNIADAYYVQVDGKKTRFNTKEDFENYKKQNGNLKNVSYYQQRDADITLEIKVPASANTLVKSVYGTIELKDFTANVKAISTYGAVDASLDEEKIGKIKITNRFGKIYSNLKLNPTESVDKNFYTSITAQPGKGSDYDISSTYGNIYLRKK